MKNQMRTWSVIVAASLVTTACTSLDLPKRGFATRYFAGSDLQKTFTTTDDFAGRPFHAAIESYNGPAALEPRGNTSSALARSENVCLSVARQRATDTAFQGFAETTQKSVFDSIYHDCMTWRANH